MNVNSAAFRAFVIDTQLEEFVGVLRSHAARKRNIRRGFHQKDSAGSLGARYS
jgi:hypothetical protein